MAVVLDSADSINLVIKVRKLPHQHHLHYRSIGRNSKDSVDAYCRVIYMINIGPPTSVLDRFSSPHIHLLKTQALI